MDLGWELVSTGGTAAALPKAGMPVTPVEEVTGFPEILDGRVKTLHPRIHAGLLARQDEPTHTASLAAHGILPFHLVAVNLYPFQTTIANPERHRRGRDREHRRRWAFDAPGGGQELRVGPARR